MRKQLICPQGAWDGHPMDRLSWRVALAREERHAELYSDVVGDWNALVEAGAAGSPLSVEQYLDHLSEVYARIPLAPHRSPT